MFQIAKISKDRYGELTQQVWMMVAESQLPWALGNILQNSPTFAIEVRRVH